MAQRGRPKKNINIPSPKAYLDKISGEVSSNQSRLSMVLGALILVVVGILIFNYFNKNKATLGPAQQTEQTENKDLNALKLPAKYTVQEGDTLFTIAEKYYKDGSKFEDIAKANNLSDVNTIITSQVLEIPKLEPELSSPSPSPPASPTTSLPQQDSSQLGIGGGNTTIWGPRIEGDTYTVAEGDWLSKIAGRAYGDIFAFKKLAEVNHISNPDLIFPGTILTIPR